MLRRALFQVHLWVGLLTGLYVFVVCVTGAALVFRIDLQRALHPHLFTASAPGPLADPVAVMESVVKAYPDYKLSGVEVPTTSRPTYLAYVTQGREFLTVLIDPVTTEVLGVLPERTAVHTLQELHYDLLGGRTGRMVNGAGAIAVLVMCVTGLVIWWPGAAGWRRGLVVDFSRGGTRVTWELHRALGIWSVVFIATFAITGLYFAFPSEFRATVNRVSPITVTRAPQSTRPAADGLSPSWREMIDRARAHAGGGHPARIVLPYGERGAFLVMFADRSPTPAGSELAPIYLDQYTGERLATTIGPRTWGDAVMAAVVPLHVGGYGGRAGKVAWFLFGLAPPVLFATGILIWWKRVVRRSWPQ